MVPLWQTQSVWPVIVIVIEVSHKYLIDLCKFYRRCSLHAASEMINFWCRSLSRYLTFSHFNFPLFPLLGLYIVPPQNSSHINPRVANRPVFPGTSRILPHCPVSRPRPSSWDAKCLVFWPWTNGIEIVQQM